MPLAMHFQQVGIAVHAGAVHEYATLGDAVSHGCVRLSWRDAEALWQHLRSHRQPPVRVRGGDGTVQELIPIRALVRVHPATTWAERAQPMLDRTWRGAPLHRHLQAQRVRLPGEQTADRAAFLRRCGKPTAVQR